MSVTNSCEHRCFGGRMDFSARDVIVPNPELKANEIRLSYLAVLELYKLEIINTIVKLNKCSYNAALKYWFDAHLQFNEFVYQVMMYLMNMMKFEFDGKKLPGMVCLINRNPTIDFGSFACVHVVGITHNYNNMTLSLPVQILDKLNADFDRLTVA